jgi:hypothetical protein
MPMSPARLGAVTAALCAVSALMVSTTAGAVGTSPGGSPRLLDTPWDRHAIVVGTPGSTNYAGSDGVDLADLNGDGQLDVVSGYEEGNQVSLSLNPDDALSVEDPWATERLASPQVSDGLLSRPEDTTFADVDEDGRLDIVVSAEGDAQVTVLFAPADNEDLLDHTTWVRTDLLASEGLVAMRAELADMNHDGSPDILVGSKEVNDVASLGYYTSSNPRSESSWSYNEIDSAGWVMQMLPLDVNNDGWMDIVYSDRDPINEPDLPPNQADRTHMGVWWLQNPADGTDNFIPHSITPPDGAGGERYHKWFSLVDWDGDSDLDVIDCRSDANSAIHELSIWRNSGNWLTWAKLSVPYPSDVGMCQHVTVADIDGDGHEDDLGISFAVAGPPDAPVDPDTLSGAVWLENSGTPTSPIWTRHEIGGADEGIKYDNHVWVDLDGDGDLDMVTSEQHEDTALPVGVGPGLGLIWYENPRLQPQPNLRSLGK